MLLGVHGFTRVQQVEFMKVNALTTKDTAEELRNYLMLLEILHQGEEWTTIKCYFE